MRQGSTERPVRPRPPDDDRELPDPDAATAVTSEVLDPDPPARAPDERDTERGLRGLVGSGSSQVGISAAMRARDAGRPTDADLAEARERLVIVRRNWVPRDDPPRGTR
ncbi:hypothetical protein GCM10022251_71950 [Phytohabitans flavus]|uniref:Uncharacterized protein n=1 Tax=Phytohabitans flavus TaxID=1076124 RepID=A0A6F8Y053_9ACTN|nr:hypothetical protein Pflav_058650 [Phytohabitans flavus]